MSDYTAMNGPAMLAACRDDGFKWAEAFCQHAKKLGIEGIDHDWMVGWFANAIEHSHDVRTGRSIGGREGVGCFTATISPTSPPPEAPPKVRRPE